MFQILEREVKETSKSFYTLSEIGFLDDSIVSSGGGFFQLFWVSLIIKGCQGPHNTELYFDMIQACALNYDYIKIHIKKNNFHETAFFPPTLFFLFSLEYTDVCSQNYSKPLRIPVMWQKKLKVIPT